MNQHVKILEAQLSRNSVETRTLSGKSIHVPNVLIAITVSDSEGRVERSYGEAQLRTGVTVNNANEAFRELRSSLSKLDGVFINVDSLATARGSIRRLLSSILNPQNTGSSLAVPSTPEPLATHPLAGALFGLEYALIGAVARLLDVDIPTFLGSKTPAPQTDHTPQHRLLRPTKLLATEGIQELVADEATLRETSEWWFDIGRRLTVSQTVRWIRETLQQTRSRGLDGTLYCYRPLRRSLEGEYPTLFSSLREILLPSDASQVRIAIDFDTPVPESLFTEYARDTVRALRPTMLPSVLEAHQALIEAESTSNVPVYLIENAGASGVGTYSIHQLSATSACVVGVLNPDSLFTLAPGVEAPSPSSDYWQGILETGYSSFQATGKTFWHNVGEAANYYKEEQFLGPIGPIGAKARLLQKAALLAGYSTVQYTKSAFSISDDDNDTLFFHGSATPLNTAGAKAICNDKETTRLILQQRGVPVPQGRSFNNADFETARAYAEQIGYPVVVKPAKGTMGIGVKAGIRNPDELELAFEHLLSSRLANQEFIVEKHIEGEEYRILVVGDEVIAAVRREAASVIGDGIHNLAELILRKNMFRRTNPQLASSPIIYTGDTENLLEEQRLTLTSVVEKNRYVKLASSSNISLGGDSREVLDLLHPSIISASLEAVKAVPGLNYCGVDFILPNPELPLEDQAAGICELNAQAATGTAEYPLFGPARPVPEKTIEHCTRVYSMNAKAPANADLLTVRLRIRGRVTGVGYRAWFKKWADLFGIVGHIVNVDRRLVEVEMQGNPLAVAALSAATISGPRRARPTSVHTQHMRKLRTRSFDVLQKRPRRRLSWLIR